MISIIIPIYNIEAYLRRCVDSVLNQSFKDFELILVNDGSSDSSIEICQYYSTIDKRIKLYDSRHLGIASARNIGLQNATGEYLAFIDGDDEICPLMLENMLQKLKIYEADIVECGLSYINENTNEIHNCFATKMNIELVTGKKLLERFSDENSVVHFVLSNKLFKRSLFENILFPLNYVHEDEFVMYKILYKTSKIVLLEDCMYNYHIRKGSIMNTYTLNRLNSYISYSLQRLSFFQFKERTLFETMLKVFFVTLFQNYKLAKNNSISNKNLSKLTYLGLKYIKNFWGIRKVPFHSKIRVTIRLLMMLMHFDITDKKCYS